MFKRYRAAIATWAVTAALIATCFIAAPTAQAAVTWTNLGTMEDHQDFDDCTGGSGHVQMKVQWEFSSDYKLRLDKDYDLKIVNQSDARIVIKPAKPWDFDPGTVAYERLIPSETISGYHYGSSNLYVSPHTTSTLSVDNPDRWYRMDGTPDSDPSPYGTHIADTSDPVVTMHAFIETYIQGAWHDCGGSTGFPIILEVMNNAA